MCKYKALKKIVSIFGFFFLCFIHLQLFLLDSDVYSGQATLSWDPPTTNADGTPLTDLAGYKIYYGTSSNNYFQNIDVGNVTTYTIDNLTDGLTYYFVATAYDTSGNESQYSNEVNKFITSTPPVQQYTLTVYRGGTSTGTGVVTSSPSGINCGSDCIESYNAGTVVTLTAVADGNSTFGGWSGACSGTGTCSVTMDASKSVTATFNIKTYTITATAGTGGNIMPSGSVTVNHGANQTFTITANMGYSIEDVLVDGNSVGAVSTYQFTNVTGNHTISARFKIGTHNLTVGKGGTGTGVVTSSPSGINCGSDCIESYNAGTVVTLTAVADGNSTFGGWSGACSGTGTCSVTMDASKSVTATFNIKTYTITATAGTGGNIMPSGSVTVNHGANQTFTITANMGYHVEDIKIDGISVGNSSSYTFNNVTENHSIYVTFNVSDIDGDGVPDIEEFGPQGNDINYDGNEDGIPDYVQDTAVSMFTFDRMNYISLFSADGKSLSNVKAEPVPDNAPNNLIFPYQILQFIVKDVGSTTTKVVLILPEDASVNGYYKYGPTPDNPVSHWYDFTFDGQTGAEIYGNLIILHLIDGLRGDDDISVNGRIFDQGAPVSSSIGVPKTGQEVSYAGGDDGDIKAGIEWPSPRFTDNGDGTVTDNLTGLMWLKDGGCMGRNSWNNALNVVSDFNINSVKYNCVGYTANYTDWRLPNVRELESLLNYGEVNPAIWLNTEGFSNIKGYYYWSSTHLSKATSMVSVTDRDFRFNSKYNWRTRTNSSAWIINMSDGKSTIGNGSYSYYVLPVRDSISKGVYDLPKTGQEVSYAGGDDGDIKAGIEWPSPRFTDNGDGTVTDNLTGLMWLKDGGCMGRNSWNNALNVVSDFNINSVKYNCVGYTANYTDWRLPNVRELESLLNYGEVNPAIWLNTEGFSNIKGYYYWSSTHLSKATSMVSVTDRDFRFNSKYNWRTRINSSAWIINMSDGKSTIGNGSYSYYVLPVRGGVVAEDK